MNKITTIGLDLAKNVFHAVCCDENGKVVRKKMLRRPQVLAYFANLPPCLVGMEACASAHHWARELGALGHQEKVIPPQYVKPYTEAILSLSSMTQRLARWEETIYGDSK